MAGTGYINFDVKLNVKSFDSQVDALIKEQEKKTIALRPVVEDTLGTYTGRLSSKTLINRIEKTTQIFNPKIPNEVSDKFEAYYKRLEQSIGDTVTKEKFSNIKNALGDIADIIDYANALGFSDTQFSNFFKSAKARQAQVKDVNTYLENLPNLKSDENKIEYESYIETVGQQAVDTYVSAVENLKK